MSQINLNIEYLKKIEVPIFEVLGFPIFKLEVLEHEFGFLWHDLCLIKYLLQTYAATTTKDNFFILIYKLVYKQYIIPLVFKIFNDF